MTTIESVLRGINRELVPQFEDRLRAFLADQDQEWLVDQIVRMALDAHSLEEMDRRQALAGRARARSDRIARVTALALDRAVIASFIDAHRDLDRVRLVDGGYLLPSAPAKGTDRIAAEHRTPAGEALLQRSKDVLFGLLFGDETMAVRLDRVQRELLTFALPRFKADALDFMKASTELSAAGTWQDPDSVSNDARADNVILEVEFGEIEGELVGHGVVRCLSLINNLEVNEQVLYARMIDVEQSTLIE
jgi:hypothetical protein